MSYKIIGKKDEKKGFSVDSLIEIANGVKIKIKDLIGLKNGEHKIEADTHEIDENTEFELANGTKYKLSDLVNQEIDFGNGKTEKLIDLVKSGKIKLSNKATDDGESADEKAAREKEEGKEAIKNCGCAGKEDGEHKEACSLYNSKGAVAFRNSKMKNGDKEKDDKIAAMENEIKALKEANTNGAVFVRVNNAKKTSSSETEALLANSRVESGSMEEGLARGLELFGTPSRN